MGGVWAQLDLRFHSDEEAGGKNPFWIDKLTPIQIATFDLDEYVYKALRAGASGFVLKDTPPERLLAALKAVADGDTLFSPTVTRRLVQAYCAAEGLVADDGIPGTNTTTNTIHAPQTSPATGAHNGGWSATPVARSASADGRQAAIKAVTQ